MIPASAFAMGRGMYRLFVALRLPPAIRSLLLAAVGGISGARWQTEEQLHLTLRFIGEVDRHQANDIHAALGGIHHPALEVAINGVGLFERRGIAAAVWAGVIPQAPVQSLHNKVDQALSRVGLAPDQRAFLPHITLARLKPASGSVRAFIEGAGGLTSPAFGVGEFALVESRLTPGGAVYDDIEVYPLG